MDAYIELVNKLAESNSEDIINNSSPDHAIALFEAMFKHGNGEARVLSGRLNPLIYGDEGVIKAITSFLLRTGNSLRVVIQNVDDQCSDLDGHGHLKENPLVKTLKEKLDKCFEERVSIKMADGLLKDLDFHFTTIGNAFRFEPDRTKKEAFASFNQAEMTKKLNTIWDKDYFKAQPISL